MRNPRILTCWSDPAQELQLAVRAASAPGPRSGTSVPRNRTGRPRTARAVSPAWFRYPRARPVPARYSSPATPGGTAASRPSSTYARTFQIGPPIGGAPPRRQRPADRRAHGRLGRTVGVEQPPARRPLGDDLARERLAADDQALQPGQALGCRPGQGGRGHHRVADPQLAQHVGQCGPGQLPRLGQDQRRPGRQRRQQLQQGHVEAQRQRAGPPGTPARRPGSRP